MPFGLVQGLPPHQAPANLRAIVDSGRGDEPLKDLRFHCTQCRSSLTDAVVMSRDALNVQPWRSEAGEGKGKE